MPKIAFYTLGCKVNSYESNALMNLFAKDGFEIVDASNIADVYIINTCSVTNSADSKSRKMIHRAIKTNPKAVICVMGCYSQTNSEAQNISGVDIILGNGNKHLALDLIKEQLSHPKKKQVEILDIRNTMEYEPLEATEFDHTRAFVKIEDGCDNFCTYCIIPYARGPVRSKEHNAVIAELTKIADMGYKEVVLAGIHTGRYKSGEDYHLSDLLNDILKSVPKIKRIRLSSIEINEIDDNIMRLMKENLVIANHLHLPLQSGCDKILNLMNRRYDTSYFLDKVNKIRTIRPDISITTDVIVGFPHETEEDFNETVDFIKSVNFSELHVFPFSPRSGTKAFDMPQVNGTVKKKRVAQLIELSKGLNNKYYKQFINKELDVIVETSHKDNLYVGHTSNYLKVMVSGDDSLIGKQVNVLIEEIHDDLCYGKII